MSLFSGANVTRVTTERLDKIIITVAMDDLVRTLRYAAAEAISEQISLKNRPTSLLVDSRGNKPIDSAERRIQAFFGNKEEVRKAVYAAWKEVAALTRVATGRALLSYELWFKDKRVGRTPAAVETYLDRFEPTTDFFRIVGPVLVYGRKIYWRPKGQLSKTGKAKKDKFSRQKIRFGKTATVVVIRTKGIMRRVEESMRRRFRSIAIAEDWVNTAPLPKDRRTPGLWIGFKRKGALKRV